jgi:serine phosphatase RsbU (regulator of sigma subunit)
LGDQQVEILTQRDQIEQQRNFAQKQKEEIEEQQKKSIANLKYAEKLQKALLPNERLFGMYFDDYFLFYQPKDFVSGDFYWIRPHEGKIIYATADSTGHGVPGSMMSVLGISILNDILKDPTLNAANILNNLRIRIKKILRSFTFDSIKEGFDIAVCIYDPNELTLEFAGAFASLHLVRGEEITVIKGDRFPAGLHLAQERPFLNHQIQLLKGDMLYTFSDGYADQFGGNEQEKKYGSKQFRHLLQSIAPLTCQGQKNLLVKELHQWKKNREQTDDMVVLGIRI